MDLQAAHRLGSGRASEQADGTALAGGSAALRQDARVCRARRHSSSPRPQAKLARRHKPWARSRRPATPAMSRRHEPPGRADARARREPAPGPRDPWGCAEAPASVKQPVRVPGASGLRALVGRRGARARFGRAAASVDFPVALHHPTGDSGRRPAAATSTHVGIQVAAPDGGEPTPQEPRDARVRFGPIRRKMAKGPERGTNQGPTQELRYPILPTHSVTTTRSRLSALLLGQYRNIGSADSDYLQGAPPPRPRHYEGQLRP